jgi:hypothetical protein
VRHPGNSPQCNKNDRGFSHFFFTQRRGARRLRPRNAASTAQRAGSFRQEEATMTLRMRLNVLAAIVSFAFLTAIVVGML